MNLLRSCQLQIKLESARIIWANVIFSLDFNKNSVVDQRLSVLKIPKINIMFESFESNNAIEFSRRYSPTHHHMLGCPPPPTHPTWGSSPCPRHHLGTYTHGTDIYWWPGKHVRLASGRYAIYWNVLLFHTEFMNRL